MLSAMRLLTVGILLGQVTLSAAMATAMSFEAFWGGTIQLFTGSKKGMDTTQLSKTLSVTYPFRFAVNFTMSVHATNPTAKICQTKNHKYSCPTYSGSVLTPGMVFESTFMTEMAPSVSWHSDAGKKYTVMLYDDNLKVCHWMCVNVPGGSLTGATECYNLFMPANMSRMAWPAAYFPPGGPSTMALPYGFLLFEQSADITGAPASILSHGVSAAVFMKRATSGDGNFNYSFPGFAMAQNMTLRGSNWFMVKGNAYSGEMFKRYMGGMFAPFTANAMQFNCSTMADSYCMMPGESTCMDIKKEFQKQGCCGMPTKTFNKSSMGMKKEGRRLSQDALLEDVKLLLKEAKMQGGASNARNMVADLISFVEKTAQEV